MNTQKRQKHKDAPSPKQILQSPEKPRDSSSDTPLLFTPTKEDRTENCWNCGEEKNPSHQYDKDKDTNVYDEKCSVQDETTSEETNVEKVEFVNYQDCHWPEYVFCYDPRSDEQKCWCTESCDLHCDLSKTCMFEDCSPFSKT